MIETVPGIIIKINKNLILSLYMFTYLVLIRYF
jgi:hypothetical protein